MPEKMTSDLTHELMNAASIDAYLQENQSLLGGWSIAQLLAALYEERTLSKAELARRAGMSEVYLHQIFSGRRKPSRDRLLCLCIGLEATMEEAQRLLKQAAYAKLYPKSRRDAIISYGLLHRIPLYEINDKLFAENEKTLF